MTIYKFENWTLDLSDYPPAPVTWLTTGVDLLCYPLQCTDWRERLGVPEGSWLSYVVPPLSTELPKVMSYHDFLQEQGGSRYSWSSLYEFAFERSSTSLGVLTSADAAFLLLILVLFVRALKSVLLPLFCSWGRAAGRRTHGEEWVAENEIRIEKFGEYVYRLVCHSLISICGFYYFHDMPWWDRQGFRFVGTKAIFRGYPYQPIEPGMAWYYLWQSAYNLDAMISLLEINCTAHWRSPFNKCASDASYSLQLPIKFGWSKNLRGDFTEMFIHHIATNLLVIGSSHVRVNRAGSVVLLIHDVSDIPVDLSKLANFLKWNITTRVCFISMTVVWMVTRLYFFVFVYYVACWTESHYYMETGLNPMLYICYSWFFFILLAVLILLHITWFFMFLRMFYKFFVTLEHHDLSEHKSGEVQPRSIQTKKRN